MRTHKTQVALRGTVLIAATAVTGALTIGSAAAMEARDATELRGRLTALNNSNAAGSAEAVVHGRRMHFDIDVRRVAKGLPHAQHIHFGAQARHECPSAAMDDANGDIRLNTAEGLPAYGPIRISLTTKGDTSPKSALAVTRFPTAPRGKIHYNRHVKKSRALARAIRRGEAVYVLHGVDYNGNGRYDFKSAGKSELDPKLPAEATDPAACTPLRVQN